MSVTNSAARALDDERRNRLEHLLAEFERTWHAGRLAECAARLPADDLRTAALVELAKIDLERRWQGGERPPAEEYAERFPELLAGGIPLELVRVELDAQRRAGLADAESFCRRFPAHADALREAFASTVRSGPPPRIEAELGTADGSSSTARLLPRGRPAEPPERFGRYLIRRRLGQGGMGAVYLAHDTELDRDVALKVPQLDGDGSGEALERFYREARAAAALRHPHLCPVYDVGRIDGTPFLTMAYIEGRTLADDIKNGPLPPDAAVALVRQLALALQFAHDRGVVHRDLKPANVLLNERGEPAITDFGLARRVDQSDAEPLTRPGAVLGTPAYMSPEQVQGRNGAVGPASDVYALGVILYELLTGQRPFRGTLTEIMIQIATEEAQPPSHVRRGLPTQLEEIVMRAMKKTIGDRYPSMGAFAAALGEYLAAPPPTVPLTPVAAVGATDRARPPATSRWLVATALLAVVVAASVIVVIIRDKDGKEVGRYEVPKDGKVEIVPSPDPKEGDKPKPPSPETKTEPKNDPKKDPKVETKVAAPRLRALGETTVGKPATLELGTTGKATLDINASAYTAIQLAAGTEYLITVDVRRGRSTNIFGDVTLLDEEGVELRRNLIRFNEIDSQFRRVALLSVKAAGKYILRVLNTGEKADFWVTVAPVPPAPAPAAVDPAKDDPKTPDPVPLPFCGETVPTPLQPGVEATGSLDAGGTAYYIARLPKGEYKAVVGLTNARGRNTNIQGYAALLDGRGGNQQSIISFNEIDVTSRKSGEFALKEPGVVILRIQVSDEPMKYVLLLRPAAK